ncbi:hypothetical protein [Acidocella aminolytica]|uniref:Uncharacterized protein n=1 Tax=Acidocella aminolytica 101 = DSM 11237 TaxID=1120923 RepID=A0A0D6PIL0_9PROT|nr:hypothetical protein [Acidocella aminolytica]GAN81512.1 hypothetical protein Aam_098_004 [Acidocella aminolytica 101 = DSM 11237]GBQ33071.1 hypothetical protein AA11237_0326 [Acidocella aminolytica 101 = DSM 11237]SHF56591.1 hypothetical protein SAMN02746095_03722 [Acidocella aminolytica 101 = DSM 11237]
MRVYSSMVCRSGRRHFPRAATLFLCCRTIPAYLCEACPALDRIIPHARLVEFERLVNGSPFRPDTGADRRASAQAWVYSSETVAANTEILAFDPAHAVQMISDTVPNPFVGREIVGAMIAALRVRGFDDAKLGQLAA